ncbi:hypothetical protein [Paraburkholderia fungorum]|uniref:hypothetical protein n=1 Tax=Paraburkholderia fungorum TaxID=134537 RepID=UPI0038B9A23F
MFTLFNRPAHSTVSGTDQVCANEMATQSAPPCAGDEAVTGDPPATYDEIYPYLMLAMVTAV